MAEVDEAPFSLLSLEDELTCSICLSPFHCPVTIPCGHNFCQDCLLATWRDSYSCPQCRTQFPTRPELKKNTVLSTVVETFSLRLNRSDTDTLGDEKKKEKKEKKEKEVVRCDTCMEAEASRTCLTCMASFCEEHLRPHRENPIFRVHQLSEPVGDLSERICLDHHRMMELFCTDHGRLICSLCLQVHKGCSFMSPEEQRSLKESELRDKMGVLDGKIEKTETVMLKVKEMQSSLKDGASKRKEGLAAVYQQMRDVLAQGECEAQVEVDRELEVGQMKLRDLMKRLTDNTETMRKAREDLSSLLSQSHTPAFLQASFDLPKVTKSEPHTPRINLDSKKVMATQTFANALKELLTEMFKQPVEDRLPIIKPDAPVSEPPSTTNNGSQQESEKPAAPRQESQPVSSSPACPPIQQYFQPVPVPVFTYMDSRSDWNPLPFHRGRPPAHRVARPFVAKTTFQTGQGKTKKTEHKEKKPHVKPVHTATSCKTGDNSKEPQRKQPSGTSTPSPGGSKPGRKGPQPQKKKV